MCLLSLSSHLLGLCKVQSYFFVNSTIAHAALVQKDTFTPRFANIQYILDFVDFLENYEVILAKFSNSCVYMLSLSLFVVVFISCKMGQ